MSGTDAYTLHTDNGRIEQFADYDFEQFLAGADRSGAETCTIEHRNQVLAILTREHVGLSDIWQIHQTDTPSVADA